VLAEEYCEIPGADTLCGYGCSDHVSWTKLGYASAFVFESEFEDHSPYIHTSGDTVENISFEHMSEFVKLVLGWGVELSA
jgi:leucyl aminopeptidase